MVVGNRKSLLDGCPFPTGLLGERFSSFITLQCPVGQLAPRPSCSASSDLNAAGFLMTGRDMPDSKNRPRKGPALHGATNVRRFVLAFPQ